MNTHDDPGSMSEGPSASKVFHPWPLKKMPLCYALANGEWTIAGHLLSEAGNHRDRQLKMALDHRFEIIDYCEEFTGSNEADQLRLWVESPGDSGPGAPLPGTCGDPETPQRMV
eukprot:s136_g18.t2